MKIKEIMTKKVITATKDEKISRIAEMMADFDIGFVVIINEEREVLGVVTDRDIVIRTLAKKRFEDVSVEEVMTHTSVNIHRDADATKALEIMGEYQIRRLVVTNDERKLCGVVSLADVAQAKYTNKLINETLYEISLPNPQKDKPLRYLKVDDYPL